MAEYKEFEDFVKALSEGIKEAAQMGLEISDLEFESSEHIPGPEKGLCQITKCVTIPVIKKKYCWTKYILCP